MVTIAKNEIIDHVLVPKHTKLSDKERDKLLEHYRITLEELPVLSIDDPSIAHLELTSEDVIKIERPSPTTNDTVFYRRVLK